MDTSRIRTQVERVTAFAVACTVGFAAIPVAQTSGTHTLTVQITDVCGAVIPGTLVKLDVPSQPGQRGHTDAGGRFIFQNVQSKVGPWILSAEIHGFQTKRIAIFPSGERSTGRVIRLVPDLSLNEEAFTDGKLASLYRLFGVVTRGDGTPVPRVRVRLWNAGSRDDGRCTTDEAGRYYISQIRSDPAPTQWHMSVESQGAPVRAFDLELQPNAPHVQVFDIRLPS